MMQIIAIAGGGAVGSLMRFYMVNGIDTWLGQAFPYGTLFVNTTGCIIMGFLYILFIDRLQVSLEIRSALFIGILGSFTTFSAFTIETLNLMENGEITKAALNILLNVGMCLTGALIGIMAGKQL